MAAPKVMTTKSTRPTAPAAPASQPGSEPVATGRAGSATQLDQEPT